MERAWIDEGVSEGVVGSGNGPSCLKLNPRRRDGKMAAHHSEWLEGLVVSPPGLSWVGWDNEGPFGLLGAFR